MSSLDPILLTKISPPIFQNHLVLRRAKITRKMKAITNYKATIVHAGPGYGKSTVISSFVPFFEYETCWYTVSTYDDEVIPFIRYIVHAIKQKVPEFGDKMLTYLQTMDRYLREEEVRNISSFFINELSELNESIVLVIDDFQYVQSNQDIETWFSWLLQHIPNNLHIVFITRTKPTWEVITPMKVKNEMLELNETDLVFSKEEVEVLIQDIFGLDLSEELIEFIYKISEGWVMAIGLLTQSLSETEMELDSFQIDHLQSLEDLFKYLANEVFMKQTPMVQQFLEQTSIFDVMTGDLCDEVLGINGSNYLLKTLSEKSVFVISIGKEQYRYHALFKEFLERRLKEDARQYNYLQQRCARWYVQKDEFVQAIAHYEKINDYEQVGAIIHQHGNRFIEYGQLTSLLEKLKKIDKRIKDKRYLLWFYEGEVHRYRCYYEEAEQSYREAYNMAVKANDTFVMIRSLAGITKIYLDTIQPIRAERALAEAIQLMKGSDEINTQEEQQLYYLMAENLINSGQAVKAQKWFEKVKQLDSMTIQGNLEARIMLRSGKLNAARKKLLSKQKEEGAWHLPQSHRETELLLSLVESFMGNPEEAKRLADKAIKQGIKLQAPFVEACGWIRLGHAAQLMDMYVPSLAKECYETALMIMEELNVSRGKAEPNMGLCVLYGYQGAYEKSIICGEEALKETEQVRDSWLSGLIYLCLFISSLINKKYDKALAYKLRAEKILTQCGDQYSITVVALWNAIYYYEMEEWESFEEAVSLFLSNVQTGDYEFILFKKTLFGPKDLQQFTPILLEAQKRDIHSAYVTSLLNELGFSHMKNHPGYTVRIQTLGSFRVWLGQKEVEERDWQRAKAKELLELFVTERKRMIPKEEIFANLWPDQEEKTVTRDFKVALNTLNKVLEPNRKPREEPFFIQRTGSSYGLNLHSGYTIDCVVFEEWARLGLEARDKEQSLQYLQQAIHMYQGDFLPDQKYADWCLTERERLLVYFLRAAEKLAQLLVSKNDYNQAIEWCERILEKDETWEEAYRLIMYCYYQNNNRPQAMKYFAKCKEKLAEELGIEPMQSTLKMYEVIMGKAN
ncbi:MULTISPECIES: BTAD domain-containing putative transcriptional regulator [Sutcliffiella]|uniref:Transcriptional regulator n=1 Tax=Sutcliffiella cohnii TaxID=33932 RepID=A0A223KME6_9BACI|nr:MULTISPECIES: BTAD domain-containing putative transcriptional regulator [Sutcliffiella]AST90524.1 transcriptional regulator [Sutcliffiella cohnii]WBL16176.1 BTAD domain-containing putative transcriptional regulator [Sutcliffiella sp. NC1]